MSRFLILHTAGAGSAAYELKKHLEHCSSATTVVEAPAASDLSSFIVRLCRDHGKYDFGIVIASIDPSIATMVEQASVHYSTGFLIYQVTVLTLVFLNIAVCVSYV